MVLVGRGGLRAIQPERRGRIAAIGGVGGIGIVRKQMRGRQVVDGWRVRRG
jgi:hypothetical protein